MIRGFGSDNFSGVLPEVFKALEEAGYTPKIVRPNL